MCTFRRPKDYKIGQHMVEITHRSKYQWSVVHPVVTLHLDKSWTMSGLWKGQNMSTFYPNATCPTLKSLSNLDCAISIEKG